MLLWAARTSGVEPTGHGFKDEGTSDLGSYYCNSITIPAERRQLLALKPQETVA
jgi:hypothetical protein